MPVCKKRKGTITWLSPSTMSWTNAPSHIHRVNGKWVCALANDNFHLSAWQKARETSTSRTIATKLLISLPTDGHTSDMIDCVSSKAMKVNNRTHKDNFSCHLSCKCNALGTPQTTANRNTPWAFLVQYFLYPTSITQLNKRYRMLNHWPLKYLQNSVLSHWWRHLSRGLSAGVWARVGALINPEQSTLGRYNRVVHQVHVHVLQERDPWLFTRAWSLPRGFGKRLHRLSGNCSRHVGFSLSVCLSVNAGCVQIWEGFNRHIS